MSQKAKDEVKKFPNEVLCTSLSALFTLPFQFARNSYKKSINYARDLRHAVKWIAKLNENKTKQEEMKGLTGTRRKLLLIELFAVSRFISAHKKSSTEVSNAFRFKATDDAFWIDDYDMAEICCAVFCYRCCWFGNLFRRETFWLCAARATSWRSLFPTLIMYELGRHDLMYDLFVPLYHSTLLIYLPRRMFRIKDSQHIEDNNVNGFMLT